MGFNKRKGISTVAALLILTIFNIAAFLLPVSHNITFWIGYSFVTLSIVLFLVSALFLFHSDDNAQTFFKLPLAVIAWVYLLAQFILGILQIIVPISYFTALIIDCGLTGIFIIAILTSKIAGETIQKQEKHIAEKVLFISNMQSLLSRVKTEDHELSQKINLLAEDLKFSDPLSHSLLNELEKQIEASIAILKSDVHDKEKAAADIIYISDLLKERNQKCKMLKNVKEEDKTTDNSGVRYVTVTISILEALVAIALVVCCIVIPNRIYQTAMSLYGNEKYEEAMIVFEELNGFSDSNEMIEACQSGMQEKKYLKAQTLFDGGEYDKALPLYAELGNYKDCKQRIEQIHNRMATENVLYYGSYQNKPIAWRTLQSEGTKMLLIAEESICELPYNDEMKNVTWEESSLYDWLNNDFIRSFSDEQLADILTTKVDGNDSKVFLLSQEEAKKLEDQSILSSEKDWWLRTKTETNAMYVASTGNIAEIGESIVHAKGIRPCIWIDLDR